jgi:hypothetical protein
MTLFLLLIWCVVRQFIYIVDYIRRSSLSIHWQFLVLIGCVVREFRDDVDSIHHLSLSIHWWFQGLQCLCFRRWFMDQPWHSVFYNSMCEPWLYFCYWFDASFVYSLTLSITYIGCYSVFIDDFKFYSYSLFAGDLWINHHITFLTIPCVSHESIFAINLMRRSSIHLRCRFHTFAVTQFSVMISMSTETQFSLTICVSATT